MLGGLSRFGLASRCGRLRSLTVGVLRVTEGASTLAEALSVGEDPRPEPDSSELVADGERGDAAAVAARRPVDQTVRLPVMTVRTAELAGRLFAAQPRWGWEFAPRPLLDVPDDPMPAWQGQGKVAWARSEYRDGVRSFRWYAAGVTAVAAGSVAVVNPIISISVFTAGLSAAAARKIVAPLVRLRRAIAQHATDLQDHEQQVNQWQARCERYQQEQLAHQTAPQWFPLWPRERPTRVDVYGGSGTGWTSLVTTMGSAELNAGSQVMVVDFSERHVADELADIATVAGVAVSRAGLLQDSGEGTLLNGLMPDAAVEVVLEAVATERNPVEAGEMRSVDAQNLQAVIRCLDGHVTFARLAAGLRVLRRLDPLDPANAVLRSTEVTSLVEQIDTIDQVDRVTNSLLVLTDKLELLAEQEHVDTDPGLAAGPVGPGGNPALTVLTSTSPHLRRKDFFDRVLFQRLRHELRTRARGAGGWRDVVVVAGADHIGLAALEGLAKDAANAGVRLVLLLEHLRGELTQLLGGAGHATLVMRMSNTDEAKAAAEFIGRDYAFQDSQVTEQVGESVTDGYSDSWSTQTSDSTNTGTHVNKPKSAHWWDLKAGSTGTSDGTAVSRSDTWQRSVNYSVSGSTSTSTSRNRVYELLVEPTRIQRLSPTGFLLIETDTAGQARVVEGDCKPEIAVGERVADGPRP